MHARRPSLLLTIALLPLLAPLVARGDDPAPVATASAPPSSSALPGPVLPDGLGVNIHFTDPGPGEMKMLADGGFTRVRMDFSWEGTERRAGEYDFGPYDRLMKALNEDHVRPVFILDYHNNLYDGGLSPHSDEGRAAFARWAAAAAKHFGGAGVIWEMYNEPNIGFWKPRPDADAYAKLALAVGKALREAAPAETYVGPATSLIDYKFLETCFKAGCLEYWSAVSVHPYRQTDPETVIEEYRRLRTLIARYAPQGRHVPILSGEWGYSSAWKGFDEARQGRYLPRQWLTNVLSEVPLSIWYDWHDDGTDPKEGEHHFGTVANAYHAERARDGGQGVYDPKPAYVAARAMTSALSGYRYSKRLIVGDEASDFVLLFARDGEPKRVKLAVWTTARDGHRLNVPASPGVFHATDYLGKALPDVTAAGKDGLAVSATDGVQYLEPEKPDDLLTLAAAWQRAPLDVVTRGGQDVSISLRLVNPLSEAAEVCDFAAAPPADEDGRRYRPLAPGAETELTAVYPTTLSDAPQVVRTGLAVRGMGALVQETHVVVTNPIRLTPLPAAGDRLPVRIDNPSARLFRGKLQALVGPESRPAEPVEVELHPGMTETTAEVRLPAPAAEAAALRVAFRLTDDARPTPDVLLTVPPAEYRPLRDFSRQAAGGPAAYRLVADGDVEIGASLHLANAAPPAGPPAQGVAVMEVRYHFEPGWKFLRLAPQGDAAKALEGRPTALGLWVFGDGQGNVGRIRFSDATGQTFQPAARVGGTEREAGKVDWTGWRYLTFPLDGTGAYHWGGAEDGVVHCPVHLDTLFLLDSAERHETEGTIYLAAPTLIGP